MTVRRRRLAISSTPSIDAGRPQRCSGTIARVRAVTARSMQAGSMFAVPFSTSTITGCAPTLLTAIAVATLVFAGTITSSPGPIP